MRRAFLPVAVLLAATVSMSACSNDNDDEPARAQIMLVHTSPDAPNVDMYAHNKITAATNVGYGTNSPYTAITASSNTNVKLAATGTQNYVVETNTAMFANKSYSVWAYDTLNAITAVVVEDNLTAPATGKAHVRFFHLSPNAPAVDILVNDSVYFNNRSYKDFTTNAANTQFVAANAGSYRVDVRLAGTITIPLSIPVVTLEAGKIYTIYAKGLEGGIGNLKLGAGVVTHN